MSQRVLAIASGGGHWIQLMRLLPAFDGAEIAYATTIGSYRDGLGENRFYVVPDANFQRKDRLVLLFLHLLWVVLRERPHVVVSTGAAPGYLAIRIARLLFGSRTIWVDSMANAEQLSLCGREVGRHADVWLTQWEHLAKPGGPAYAGSVL